MSTTADNLRQARLDKLQHLKESQINPYPYSFQRTHSLAEVIQNFQALSRSQETLKLAGRVMLWRPQGEGLLLERFWIIRGEKMEKKPVSKCI
jgi:lysyl-tRNA synthetase class 2